MINTDKNIREIFSKKLGNFEVDVPDGLWEKISQNLPAESTIGGSSAVVKTAISKMWIAAGITAIVTAGILVMQLSKSDSHISNIEQPIIENPVEQKAEEKSADLVQNIQDNSNILAPKVESASSVKNNTQEKNTQSDINPIEPQSATNNSTWTEENITGNQQDKVTQNNAEKHSQNDGDANQIPGTTNQSKAEEFNSKFNYNIISEDRLEYKFVASYSSAKNYLWTFEDGTQLQGQSATKQFDVEGEQRVLLTVTSNDGLQKSSSNLIAIFKKAEFFIPNVFTPNNDGQNDVFDPQEKSLNLKITKVIVLDDKGKVFESDGEKFWDGTDLQGNPCPAGNYYFMVRATDRNHKMIEKTGSIRLIR